jgi:hypothetical protein
VELQAPTRSHRKSRQGMRIARDLTMRSSRRETMSARTSRIRFKAKLNRPAAGASTAGSWTFLTLPKAASAKLPSRGMTSVEGTINGHPFRATLEPDGNRSHWLKVSRKLREAAGAEAGDIVTLEIAAKGKEPEPRMPADLRKALASAPKARAVWKDITPIARRDCVRRLVHAGSKMPARCSPAGSGASAASIAPVSTARA